MRFLVGSGKMRLWNPFVPGEQFGGVFSCADGNFEVMGFSYRNSVDLLLRSDHDTLTEQVLQAKHVSYDRPAGRGFSKLGNLGWWWFRTKGNFEMFPPMPQNSGNSAYLVDRLAIGLGNKHLGG